MTEGGAKGRSALVTGASSGIGAAIATDLASTGVAVTVNFFRSEAAATELKRTIEAAGGRCHLVRADMRRRDEVKRLFAEHIAEHGGVDILVNNAGDMVRRMPTEDTPEEVWRDAIDLNLSSAFYSCQEAIGPMRQRGWGRIVNISSVGGRTGGGAGSIPYHAAKAAMMALTKGLAKEVALANITVNTLAPGIIETAFHGRHTRPELKDEWVRSLIPMQRAGTPAEIAKAVTFLCSDDASYITGATLDVNGGMAMY